MKKEMKPKAILRWAIIAGLIGILGMILLPETGRLINPASPQLQAKVKLKEVHNWYSSYTTRSARIDIPKDLDEVREWASSLGIPTPGLNFQIAGSDNAIEILYFEPKDPTVNELVFVLDKTIPVSIRSGKANELSTEPRYVGIYENHTIAILESRPERVTSENSQRSTLE